MSLRKIMLVVCGIFCFSLGVAMYLLVKKIKVDLVTKEYIAEAKNYQQVIEAKKRAQEISAFRMAKADPFIVLQVPHEHLQSGVKGEVFFYCVYDEKLDKTVQLAPDNMGQQMVPQSWIRGKRYKVKLSWHNGEQSFYTEHELNINH